MSQLDLKAAIENSDLPNKAAIADVVRTGILALGNQVAEPTSVGSSRIGGRPDVPADFEWPTWEDFNEETIPLTFIAQINLAELPDCPDRSLLPAVGLLSFYYVCHQDISNDLVCGHEADEMGAFRVFHFAETDSVSRFDRKPSILLEIEQDWERTFDDFYFPAVPLRFETCETIPDGEHPAMTAIGCNYVEHGFASYERLMEVLEAAGYTSRVSPEGFAHNQLLGYPSPIQTSVCQDMQHAIGGEFNDQRAMSWELLLQVDTQDDVNQMIWGDCGRIYFMIPREDLLARRWDKAHLIMQCS